MERNVDEIYKKLKSLNKEDFEMITDFLSKCYHKENKIPSNVNCSVHAMIDCLSYESFKVIIDMINECLKNNVENNTHKTSLKSYYEFTVAKYALSDCIEALKNNNAKEIIVTKEDGNLIVRYKPYWKK